MPDSTSNNVMSRVWILIAGVLLFVAAILIFPPRGHGLFSNHSGGVDRFMSAWTRGDPSAVATLLDSRSPVSRDIIGRFDIKRVTSIAGDGEQSYVLQASGESVATEEFIATTVWKSEGNFLPLRIRVGVAKDSGKVFSLYFFDDLP